MPERRFESKTGIITGGAKGIGRATVLRFIAEGGRAAVFDQEPGDGEAATSLHDEAGDGADRLLYLSVDVTDETLVTDAVQQVEAAFGPVHVLVNNAGLSSLPRPIEDISQEEWERFLAINATSTFLVTRAVLPGMRARGYGRIVNVSSSSGRTASPLTGIDYSSAKAAVIGLTRKLAYEEGPNGITVNAVAPGLVFSDYVRPRFDALSEEEQARALAPIPLRRGAEPKELAMAILFLVSDDASYVTGVTLDVNGGRFIG